MSTIINPALLNDFTLYADKENLRAFLVTFITGLIVLAGFRFAREAVTALLMKLYNVFIQRNAAGL